MRYSPFGAGPGQAGGPTRRPGPPFGPARESDADHGASGGDASRARRGAGGSALRERGERLRGAVGALYPAPGGRAAQLSATAVGSARGVPALRPHRRRLRPLRAFELAAGPMDLIESDISRYLLIHLQITNYPRSCDFTAHMCTGMILSNYKLFVNPLFKLISIEHVTHCCEVRTPSVRKREM